MLVTIINAIYLKAGARVPATFARTYGALLIAFMVNALYVLICFKVTIYADLIVNVSIVSVESCWSEPAQVVFLP